jgi:hypothetical protein
MLYVSMSGSIKEHAFLIYARCKDEIVREAVKELRIFARSRGVSPLALEYRISEWELC